MKQNDEQHHSTVALSSAGASSATPTTQINTPLPGPESSRNRAAKGQAVMEFYPGVDSDEEDNASFSQRYTAFMLIQYPFGTLHLVAVPSSCSAG